MVVIRIIGLISQDFCAIVNSDDFYLCLALIQARGGVYFWQAGRLVGRPACLCWTTGGTGVVLDDFILYAIVANNGFYVWLDFGADQQWYHLESG